MARVTHFHPRKILDSRGFFTLEVGIILDDGTYAWASVPQGKSVGSYEAAHKDENDSIRAIETIISPRVIGFEAGLQRSFDELLITLDGMPDKSKLGGNTTLALSVAYARASAIHSGRHLWQYLRDTADTIARMPRLFVNLINGGLHAGNELDLQEYLIIPKTNDIHEAVSISVSMYHSLKESLVAEKGSSAGNVGDEGGYAPDMQDNLEPFRFLKLVGEAEGLWNLFDLGVDVAAGSTFMDARELRALYTEMRKEYDVRYIEDPFFEDDFQAFASLNKEIGGDTLICGDDLTTTNVDRMKKAHTAKSINSIIIKPNQIGTITESIDAVELARTYGWQVVVSHRSGESNDDFIADFAYAVGADGIKLGAPARGERVAKYNRLLHIADIVEKL